jgi:hypothetical protein
MRTLYAAFVVSEARSTESTMMATRWISAQTSFAAAPNVRLKSSVSPAND